MSEVAIQYDDDRLPQRTLRALDETDAMPADLRQCVHEYGYAIVNACRCAGVTEPRRIRQLVKEIWDGARQPHQRNQATNGVKNHARPLDRLDWLLIQAGAQINASSLLRVLYSHGMVVVPFEPSNQMIAASMAEVRDFNLKITKIDKHRRRLRAATSAAVNHLWPHLSK